MLAVASAGVACALVFGLVMTVSRRAKKRVDDEDSDEESSEEESESSSSSSSSEEEEDEDEDEEGLVNPYGLSSASISLGLSSVQVGETTKKGKRSQRTKKYDPRDVRKKQSKADRELRAMKVTETWEASVTKTHKTPPPRSRGGARAVTSDVKLKDAADDDGQLV